MTGLAARREAAAHIAKWWKAIDPATLVIDREAALSRCLRSPSTRPYALGSVRERLRASADTLDVRNERGSRTAWRALDGAGEGLLDDLKPILKNVDEDLDIRAEAIRWHVRLVGKKKAKRQLKKLRKDPNPEIAELAKDFLEE